MHRRLGDRHSHCQEPDSGKAGHHRDGPPRRRRIVGKQVRRGARRSGEQEQTETSENPAGKRTAYCRCEHAEDADTDDHYTGEPVIRARVLVKQHGEQQPETNGTPRQAPEQDAVPGRVLDIVTALHTARVGGQPCSPLA